MPSETLTRRDVIVSLLATGGGLLLMTQLTPVASGQTTGQSPTPSAGEQLRAYLRITPAGEIIVTVPAAEMGQGTTTALPMLLCEELDASWDRVRFEQARPAAIYGEMVTEASATTRYFFTTLRNVGATARMMLIEAAAKRWQVDPDGCSTDRGYVIHGISKRKLSYGELAVEAAAIPVPTEIPLKAQRSFRLIGQATPFIDLVSKVDGSAVYGLDVQVPGMMVAAIRHGARFGSRVGKVDFSRAASMSGVHEIVVLEDAVVAVADTYWHAKRAVDAIDFPTLGGIDAADATIVQALEEAVTTPGEFGTGPSVDPLADQHPALDAVYHFPYLAHAPMEPMNCTAVVRNGHCEIWAPTQGPRVAQSIAARITGFPTENINVHTTYLGGGFGRRSKNDFVEKTIRVAMRIKRPVKLVWSREEDIAHDFYRPAMAVRIRGRVGSDGSTAIDARLAGPSILAAYQPKQASAMTYDKIAVEGLNDTPYGFHAFRSSYRRVEPGVPIWFWRSVSNSHNTFALECALDELAQAAGIDGVRLRERLLASRPLELAVLQHALKLAGTNRSAGTTLGVALAQMRQTTIAVVAEVSMTGAAQVRLHRITCAVDCGLVVNPLAAEAQIQGGIVWGLSGAVWGEIGIAEGQAVQRNFDTYRVARITHIPSIDVSFIGGGAAPGGLGEVGAGAIAPALANAIRAAGGPTIRSLPFSRSGITIERA